MRNAEPRIPKNTFICRTPVPHIVFPTMMWKTIGTRDVLNVCAQHNITTGNIRADETLQPSSPHIDFGKETTFMERFGKLWHCLLCSVCALVTCGYAVGWGGDCRKVDKHNATWLPLLPLPLLLWLVRGSLNLRMAPYASRCASSWAADSVGLLANFSAFALCCCSVSSALSSVCSLLCHTCSLGANLSRVFMHITHMRNLFFCLRLICRLHKKRLQVENGTVSKPSQTCRYH